MERAHGSTPGAYTPRLLLRHQLTGGDGKCRHSHSNAEPSLGAFAYGATAQIIPLTPGALHHVGGGVETFELQLGSAGAYAGVGGDPARVPMFVLAYSPP